jgi:predicted ATP-dependent endonuclease of OLD family
MYIESVLKRFKRFQELRIELPPGVKLVMLAGPNGTGKSSVFDGFTLWHRANASLGFNWDKTYFPKSGERDLSAFPAWNQHIEITFYEDFPAGPTRASEVLRDSFSISERPAV